MMKLIAAERALFSPHTALYFVTSVLLFIFTTDRIYHAQRVTTYTDRSLNPEQVSLHPFPFFHPRYSLFPWLMMIDVSALLMH